MRINRLVFILLAHRRPFRALTVALLFGLPAAVSAAVYRAEPDARPGTPAHYLTLLAELTPGDTLQLPAGRYHQRLDLRGLHGQPDAWITITGPPRGDPAVITTHSVCCNTVQLGDTSYVAIKHLTIDSNSVALGASIDAINAKGKPTHHILIEDCTLLGAGYHQQTVGISTKSSAWNWTVRRTRIIGAGTGMYFGNSDGSAPFIGGRIENNLVLDTIGYNLQIKHQNPYARPTGLAPAPQRTLIRHNVLVKSRPQSAWPAHRVDGPRPNLLVDGVPAKGPGASDRYEIYANLLYLNPDEALIQGAGRLSIHDNLLVGGHSAIRLRDHNRPLLQARVYHNTLYGAERGIELLSTPDQGSALVGNLILARRAVRGEFAHRAGNILAPPEQAPHFLTAPGAGIGTGPSGIDLYPRPGRLQGEPLDLSLFADDTAYDRDFNGQSKGAFRFRGAYAGEGHNPGWRLSATLKHVLSPAPPRTD